MMDVIFMVVSIYFLIFVFACSAIRGCLCSRAVSVDGQYDLDYVSAVTNSFFYNDTSNTSVLFTDQDLVKFYRW